VVDRMLTRYGTRAIDVLAAIPAGASPLEHAPAYYAEELAHLAATEQAVHLIDIVLRRTSLAFVGGMSVQTLREVAEAVAAPLGWDAERRDQEVADTVGILRDAHRVDFEEVDTAHS
jgi:glycerol-3-phosphate dehydrogenase